ncbi:MAG: 5'-3' exonuclease H3TH domain-containing protein, partial [Pseudomonadota bacterium]
LLLVDGSSYLYRAFHALPDLRNSKNEPTGAIRGVLSMLRKLHKDYPADYSACIFDAKGKTFRDTIYPEYKANRPSMPDDLRSQVEPLLEAIKAMGWPLLVVDGVEADDVIGCLAEQAEKQGVRVIISTGDKDMSQLVNEHVTVVNTMPNAFRKGDEVLDIAGVEAKFGLKPALIVDYLTLIGDTVDNVPGVEKVGPKTAVKWLQEYGSLDNIIASADKFTGVVGENLRKALDWLPTGRDLITIKCDLGDFAGIPQSFEPLQLQLQDTAKLSEIYDRFEFKTWQRELGQSNLSPSKSAQPNESGKEKKTTSSSQSGYLFGDMEAATDLSETNDTEPAVTNSVNYQTNTSRQYETILTNAQLNAWLEKIRQSALFCFDT